MRLSPAQMRALRMQQKGKDTFIIDNRRLHEMPTDMIEAVMELPGLVKLKLMHRERLDRYRTMYRITQKGRELVS